ncbi:ABC transporter substrate-binding protein [uncultured Tyzzerella sp.]|uniref:ABC transporter substrate-binding protein n=1 Tax=uncultured Tyzzerella sp. TaxID=2321398 RepID=UPI0029437F57|nr:ABC transporter substrate-binding protein [uncultured Tyzzerella sp.]
MKFKKFLLSISLISSILVGCGSTSTEKENKENVKVENNENTDNTDTPQQNVEQQKKISVASVAISQILSDMNVDIVGRPTTKLTLPNEYLDVAEIGSSFSPDFEKVLSVGTELLIGDTMFKDKIEKTAQEYGIETFYVDTSTYEEFLSSIDMLGKKIGKEKEATEIIEKFKKPLNDMTDINKDIKVAIIMGSSESNMLATENTYIGSLVKALGVKNIATEVINNGDNPLQVDPNGYINLNLEQLLKNEPDIILAFGHGNMDSTKKAFEQLFNENPALKSLTAVKNNKVYYLDSAIFGTSANNVVDKALIELGEILNEN